MNAERVDAIRVCDIQSLPNGIEVLLVSCHDHERYAQLPEAVRFDGQLFGKTGWSSDAGFAYFRTDATLAFPEVGHG